MNLKEYQKQARSTAIYLKIDNARLIYPALGLIGECGEIAEKIKKLIRDDMWIMGQDRKDAIAKELGDCCWYLANICCDTDLDLSMIYTMSGASSTNIVRSLDLPRLVLRMNRHAIKVTESLEQWYYNYDSRPGEIERFTQIPNSLSYIITCVEEIANRCDLTLEEIYTANLEKLARRKRKGTLTGEGDDR